ncbi:MAG: OmpA family protein, partial [Bacteroidota bacterium]|nr:OmpA family protein [Bacteroidota bacterium]
MQKIWWYYKKILPLQKYEYKRQLVAMRRFIVILIIMGILIPSAEAQSKKKKRKVKQQPKVEAPSEIALPQRSADCLFAVNLMLDSAFGPTEPLNGFGFVNDIKRDAQTKNVFEQEHNTVWYKVNCPYDGKLIIDIKPKSELDDYDFLVYKYTDQYFCNRVEKNRVKPLRSVLSSPNATLKGATGLSLKGNLAHISKSSDVAYARYIDVKMGESYIIVLDNLQDGGLGHTIRAEIVTDYKPLYIQPIDSLSKQRTTANIRVKDISTEMEIMNLTNVGNTKVKILPDKVYDIYVTKEGFFNYQRRIGYNDLNSPKDSILSVQLSEIKIGGNIPLNGTLSFDNAEDGTVSLLPDSYKALDGIVEILTSYPNINVEIVGRIATDGLNLRLDNENSKKRADAIKDYLVEKGIPETNISTRGSSNKELLKQIDNQNKAHITFFPECEIRI